MSTPTNETEINLDGLAQSVQMACALIDLLRAERDTLKAENTRLREALTGLMKLIENGELVRDISHDHESTYVLRALNLGVKLKNAQMALDGEPAALAAGKGEK